MRRVVLMVSLDLDPTPGSFHTVESAARNVEAVLNTMIPHYEPEVTMPLETGVR